MKLIRFSGAFFSLAVLVIALCAFQKVGNLTPTLKFIHDNLKYDPKTKTHSFKPAMIDSIDYYSVDGKSFFEVFMGVDTPTIKKTLGEPDQNWLYTYRYFFDTCCYHLDNAPCSFNCQCLMLRISPQGKCSGVRLGRYFKGQ